MKNHLKKALLLIFSFSGLVLIVSQVDWSVMKAEAEERYTELQNFAKVLNLIQTYYVEEVDTKKMIEGAIKGMLRELDPHTNYMPPELFKDFESETSGEFGGLGIEISVQNGILTIISPIEDTPAWEAGIKPGDKIIAVDGKSTKGLSLVEASQLMRGKTGSRTVLTIFREGKEGKDEPFDVAITRASVKIRSVKPTSFDDGYEYIKITSFIENTGKELEKALEEAKKRDTKIKGLVLDLRRNPGGLLEQAVRVCDLFIDEGAIVSTIGRDPRNKEVANATKREKYNNFPVVILMNEYSASASEIVAGAMQDHHRAVIMGQRSFGKGSVQSVIKLGDGSGLKLTVARYYTPSGRSIQAEGIVPDIEVEDVDFDAFTKAIVRSHSQREKDIQGHLLSEKEKVGAKKFQSAKEANANVWWKEMASKKDDAKTPKEKLLTSDYQVYQAYNYLKAWKIMSGSMNVAPDAINGPSKTKTQ
jgi:carboxyl-terminal processing protease